jgi:hypothetical protein
MTNFEDELKRALARHSPPSDFNARVLTAIEERRVHADAHSLPAWVGWIWSRRSAPILVGALTLSAGAIYWQHERVERGQSAKRQLLVAMHIAGSELQHTRQLVFERGPETKQ